MFDPASPFLTPWASFYVMTGTSAATLTGLMFVVITVVRGQEAARSRDGISTFSTPTVMHFCTALLVSATLVAPWKTLTFAPIAVGIVGVYGIVYVARVMLLTKRLTAYRADIEDWLWYNVLPLLAYAALLGGAAALRGWPATALFGIAGGVLLLIFIGIRNAWDVVTFLAVGGPSSG